MGLHSRFSPSATEREYTCPGSFLLNEKVKDVQSEDAAHGTAAHHVAQLCLQHGHDVDVYAACLIAVSPLGECRFVHENAPLREDEMGFEVDDEMVVAVQEYVDYCRALPGEHFVEIRVDHTRWCPDTDEFGDPLGEQKGTSDHIACVPAGADDFEEATIVVTDLKYGKGVQVFAKENKQAIKYALGAWQEYDWLYGFKRVRIRIAQPRLKHFDEWEITIEELLEWGEKIKKRLELVFQPDPPFQPSEKGCKFCKVNGQCRALHDHLHSIVALQFDDLTGDPVNDPRLLSDEEIRRAYYAGPLLKIAMEAAEREVFRRLAEGKDMGRLKLVASITHRAWRDEEAVIKFLRSKGVDDEHAIKKTLVSPAQAEKLLPSAVWAELEGLVVRPPGKPVIADASDSRPAYRDAASVVESFDDIDDGF